MSETPRTGYDSALPDAATVSGLDLMRAYMTSEQHPPSIGQLLGMTLIRVDFGAADFQLTTQPLFANPLGTVHGGIAATMLDSAMGCAIHTTLPAGDWYTTLELKLNYIRAVATTGRTLTAYGHTVHVGRSTATAEGKITDDQGNLIAHGTTTCLLRRNNTAPS